MTLLENLLKTAPIPDIEKDPQPAFPEYVPADLLEREDPYSGWEGFWGESYLRLYPLSQLLALNRLYQVERYVPGLFVFGSTGGGHAFAFDKASAVVKIPFIPMDAEYKEPVCGSFGEFCMLHTEGADQSEVDPSLIHQEICEITPIIFGGSPTDFANKCVLAPRRHAEAVEFWNMQYYTVKKWGRTTNVQR